MHHAAKHHLIKHDDVKDRLIESVGVWITWGMLVVFAALLFGMVKSLGLSEDLSFGLAVGAGLVTMVALRMTAPSIDQHGVSTADQGTLPLPERRAPAPTINRRPVTTIKGHARRPWALLPINGAQEAIRALQIDNLRKFQTPEIEQAMVVKAASETAFLEWMMERTRPGEDLRIPLLLTLAESREDRRKLILMGFEKPIPDVMSEALTRAFPLYTLTEGETILVLDAYRRTRLKYRQQRATRKWAGLVDEQLTSNSPVAPLGGA